MDILRRKRLVLTLVIFFMCFLGLAMRLWRIQITEGEVYSCLALEQGSLSVSLEDTPRGRFLDRNLVPLNEGKTENKVVVFPEVVKDQDRVAKDLAQILGVNETAIKSYLTGGAVYLPYGLTSEQTRLIQQKNWTGIMALPVHFRYGENSLAAQTIGHLGKVSTYAEYFDLVTNTEKFYRYDDLVGKTGLEKVYEEDLKGNRPKRAVRVFKDAKGKLLGGPGFELEEQVSDRGRRDVVLTLDSSIQQVVEDTMDREVGRGAVVVMEAGTGNILAMASRPGFDPAHPEQNIDGGAEGSSFDHCTALYQPGSVFKIVVAAAALEEDPVRLKSPFTCLGENEDLMHCWKAGGHGRINFASAFAESCNPTFARIGLDLGAQQLIEYARRLGLENQNIIGYPAGYDARQDLNLIGEPYNLVNCSIGQGPVLVTPLQVAAMTNTIISGGTYRVPRLVKEIRSNSGSVVQEFYLDAGSQALSPGTAEILRSLMESVVDGGTGTEAAIPVFGSAGKTGSAQVGSSGEHTDAWFTGYAPRKTPRYVVTVLVEGGASGSEFAAPIFREITESILKLG
ncbi:MAG: penicillin-binding transpeptidase domain-containing protein [Desulfotomaculaceae bacterium]|nr:penicillin-binding transpeptidase domain-containing protein [Desulfotomaculaceae bacterium]MDD4767333.1 penicillin-binding transpeptidase domain-containing protein [Desulfotomaculaceae bacterium]